MVFHVRVNGHELVTLKRKVQVQSESGRLKFETEEFEMLRVKLQGIGEDDKTRVTLLVDPDDSERYPLGDRGEVSFEIRQGRLALEGIDTVTVSAEGHEPVTLTGTEFERAARGKGARP